MFAKNHVSPTGRGWKVPTYNRFVEFDINCFFKHELADVHGSRSYLCVTLYKIKRVCCRKVWAILKPTSAWESWGFRRTKPIDVCVLYSFRLRLRAWGSLAKSRALLYARRWLVAVSIAAIFTPVGEQTQQYAYAKKESIHQRAFRAGIGIFKHDNCNNILILFGRPRRETIRLFIVFVSYEFAENPWRSVVHYPTLNGSSRSNCKKPSRSVPVCNRWPMLQSPRAAQVRQSPSCAGSKEFRHVSSSSKSRAITIYHGHARIQGVRGKGHSHPIAVW